MKNKILLFTFIIFASTFLISCSKDNLKNNISKEEYEAFKKYISNEEFIKISDGKLDELGKKLNKDNEHDSSNEMPYSSTPTVEVYKNGDKIYQSKSGSIVILDNNKKIVYVDIKSPLASDGVDHIEGLVSSKLLGDLRIYYEKSKDTLLYVKNNDFVNIGSGYIISRTKDTINKIVKIRDIEDNELTKKKLQSMDEALEKVDKNQQEFKNKELIHKELICTSINWEVFSNENQIYPGSTKFDYNLSNEKYFLAYKFIFKTNEENSLIDYLIVYANPFSDKEEVDALSSFFGGERDYPKFEFQN